MQMQFLLARVCDVSHVKIEFRNLVLVLSLLSLLLSSVHKFVILFPLVSFCSLAFLLTLTLTLIHRP